MKSFVILAFMLLGAAGLRAASGNDQNPFTLTTLLGETFQHCRIIKVTPEAVTISHDNGVTKVPFENLNNEWKRIYGYSPAKAAAFQKEEAERRAVAEAKRKKVQKEYEKVQTKQMSQLAAAERERVTQENRFAEQLARQFAQQQVESAAATAAATASQPGVLVPLPGDPTPYLNGGMMATTTTSSGRTTRVQSTTEVLVPSGAPITQIYTPSATGGQRYIINQGTIFTPGDGSLYYVNPGYVNPGYSTPGYVVPNYVNPPIIVYPQGGAARIAPHQPRSTPFKPGLPGLKPIGP